MAISKQENNIETMKVNTNTTTKNNILSNKHFTNQTQMIGEFLDMVEDIEMSATSSYEDDDFSSVYQDNQDDSSFAIEQHYRDENNMHCANSAAFDEATVQEIIANDDRLNKEVEEFMQGYSMTIDEDEDDLFGAMDSIFMHTMGSEPQAQ
jgi:hypothetical protein